MKLTITFTGICAFARGFRHVVMPESTVPRVSKNNANVIIPAHYVYLRIPNVHLNGGKLPQDVINSLNTFSFEYEEPVTLTRSTHTVVLFKQMQISVTNPTPGHSIPPGAPPTGKVPAPGEEKLLHWVSDIEKVYQEAVFMDTRYLDTPPPPNIGAFAKLDNSAVEAARVPTDHAHEFLPSTQPPAQKYVQALALGVSAMFTVPNPPFEIKLSSYDPRDPAVSFTIPIVPDPATGNANVVVGNSPLDAVLQVAHRHAVVPGVPNYDFELFYELSRQRPSFVWPVPVCESVGLAFKDLGSENCPPASMKP